MEETGRSAWLAPAVRPTPRRPRGATAGASSAFPVRPPGTHETVENVGGLTPPIGTRLAPTLGAGPPVRVAIPASETPCYRRRMASDWPPDRPPWGVWTDLLALDRESEMKWRVMVELGGAEGTVELHEVSVGGGPTTEYSAETHIRWRLWHGQVQRALDLIGDTLGPLEAMAKGASPVSATAGKVADVLRTLETYVSGQSELIID